MATCFNDVHVLDTQTLAWSQPAQVGPETKALFIPMSCTEPHARYGVPLLESVRRTNLTPSFGRHPPFRGTSDLGHRHATCLLRLAAPCLLILLACTCLRLVIAICRTAFATSTFPCLPCHAIKEACLPQNPKGPLPSCNPRVTLAADRHRAHHYLHHHLQAGAKVSPRAGHTGAVLGDVWYIVGGGNNVKGCADLLAADLSQLAASGTVTWHVVASVALRDPLSSEGIALVALPAERVLLAFGGYNGKYQSAVSIFRAPEGAAALLSGPVAVAAARVEEAKAAAAGGKGPAAAAGEAGKTAEAGGKQQPAAAAPAALSAEQQAAELQKQVAEFKAQLEGARKDAESAIREAAAAKEGAAHELSLLRKQVTSTQGALADANKVRGVREVTACTRTLIRTQSASHAGRCSSSSRHAGTGSIPCASAPMTAGRAWRALLLAIAASHGLPYPAVTLYGAMAQQ